MGHWSILFEPSPRLVRQRVQSSKAPSPEKEGHSISFIGPYPHRAPVVPILETDKPKISRVGRLGIRTPRMTLTSCHCRFQVMLRPQTPLSVPPSLNHFGNAQVKMDSLNHGPIRAAPSTRILDRPKFLGSPSTLSARASHASSGLAALTPATLVHHLWPIRDASSDHSPHQSRIEPSISEFVPASEWSGLFHRTFQGHSVRPSPWALHL